MVRFVCPYFVVVRFRLNVVFTCFFWVVTILNVVGSRKVLQLASQFGCRKGC